MKVTAQGQKVIIRNPSMTAPELKNKVTAYQELFGAAPTVTVEGNWYGPIDYKEFPSFSIHGEFIVHSIGRKYIEIFCHDGTRHRVLVSENGTNEYNSGAYCITLE